MGTPRNLQISSVSGRLAEPVKILKRLSSESLEGLRVAGFGAEAPSPETRTGSAIPVETGAADAAAEPFSVLDGEFGIETAVVFCSLTLETPPGWLTY